MFSFPWCSKKQEEEEKCGAIMSGFQMPASDKYEKITQVTKGYTNE